MNPFQSPFSISFLLSCLIPGALICTSGAALASEAAPGFSNESEAGVVVQSGNTSSQTYSLRQLSQYLWPSDALRMNGRFLRTSVSGVEASKNWLLGVRYERSLGTNVSGYAGASVDSDIYAGFSQRYNADVGAKYYFVKREHRIFFLEAGYRRAIENRLNGWVTQDILRLYTEAHRAWTRTFSTKTSLEYLPNFTIGSDYQLNYEISASAAMTDIFALKMGYLIRYRRVPAAPATERTDTQFISTIVAKF